MKYIIMCGGHYSAWETPRQLTQICGEALIARTIRLLHDEGADDVMISTIGAYHDDFSGFGVPVIMHDNDFAVVDGECKGAWVHAFGPRIEPACYLMGDVCYSPEAIRTIVRAETDDVLFFASTPPFSPLYVKESAEPFAFKVVNQRRFRAAIDYVAASVNAGIFRRHPIAWELWQVLIGRNVREISYETIYAINDYTCDVDHPEDSKRIEDMICTL